MTATPPLNYRCDPFNAWISEAQCAANARRAKSKGDAGMVLRDKCPGCPGVRALTKRLGLEPRPVSDFRSGVPPAVVRPPCRRVRRNPRVTLASIHARVKPPEDSITISEAARLLGVGYESVRLGLRRAGLAPIVQGGRGRGSLTFYPRGPVLAWIEKRRAMVGAPRVDAEATS